MTITRANVGGWAFDAFVTLPQINKLDVNFTNALDKRANQTDTLGSVVTVSTDGGFSFATGSQLTIPDPTVVSSAAGLLQIPPTLRGISNPLLRGNITKNFTDSSAYILTSDGYVQSVNFTGSITASKNITVPSNAGYRMQVINSTSAILNFIANGGSKTISIRPGCSAVIYCDGSNINSLGKTTNADYQLISVNQNISSGFSGTLYNIYYNTLPTVAGIPCLAGDILDISFMYNGGLTLTCTNNITGPLQFCQFEPTLSLISNRTTQVSPPELIGYIPTGSQSAGSPITWNTATTLRTLYTVASACTVQSNLTVVTVTPGGRIDVSAPVWLNAGTGIFIKQYRQQ
jgi:hypothetical protein